MRPASSGPPMRPSSAPSTAPPTGPSPPLIVTADESLLDQLLRLSAAAGVVPDVAHDADAGLRSWAAPPVVLVGADLAGALARLAPARRGRVHVVSEGRVADDLFRTALRLGAENVVELPLSEAWVVEVLSDLEGDGLGLTVGVIGGSGGAGATTFACALGQVAARTGPAVVIDADPLGPGVDRVLGFERLDGVRWESLQQTTGRLSGRALRDALPARQGLGVLTWSPGRPGVLQAFAVREALAAAQRGHDLVVVDLPRRLDPLLDEVVSRCDHLFVLVQPSVVGIASAARTCARLGGDRVVTLVVRRGAIDAGEVARIVGVPDAVELADQRGLAEAIDLGAGPVRARRGPLGRVASQSLRRARGGLVARVPA